MGRVVVPMAVSVDGFFEGPDADISWHRVDDELHAHMNEALASMRAFAMGRVNYLMMEAFWPTADQDPAVTGPMREFAQIWRETPKVVYSRTLDAVNDNATLVRQVVPDEVRGLVADGDIVVGGADLAASFQGLGLVDEYRVYVHPVVIGAGRRLFAPHDQLDLRLIEQRAFGNGVALLRYEVER